MKRFFWLAFLMIMIASVPGAMADSITFDLDTGNTAISPYVGPYANVMINLTSTTEATITFTSLTNSGNIYLLGDGGSVGVNVNATSWVLGAITGSNAGVGFTPGPYSDGGSGNEDGWGAFNQTINSFDGFTHSSDLISFTLTNTSGTWASAADVLALNSQNAVAAAHIFVTSNPADASNGAVVTGFASGSGGEGPGPGPTPIPEPSSLLFIGSGIVLTSLMLRRRRK